MHNTIRTLALVAGCCFGLVGLPGVGFSQHFYVKADTGVSFPEDVDLHRFLTPTPNGKFRLDTGGSFNVAGGYNFNDFVGAQIETGFTYNEVKGTDGDLALSHVPLLVDIVLRYDRPNCKLVPYLGAGAGGDTSIIYLDWVRAPNGAIVDGSASDVVFAWQVFAGARYRLNDNMSVGAGYKFFWADGASWDVDHSFGDIKTGKAQVHTVSVEFNWTF